MKRDAQSSFLLGLAIGIAGTLLFSSKKVRYTMSNSAKRFGRKVDETAEKTKNTALQKTQQAKQTASTAKEKVTSKNDSDSK